MIVLVAPNRRSIGRAHELHADAHAIGGHTDRPHEQIL